MGHRVFSATPLAIFRGSCQNPARLRGLCAYTAEENGEEGGPMAAFTRWTLGLVIAVLVVVVPVVDYRWTYTHAKRLRVVTPEKFYRSGEMTASGFREAVARLRIRTIVNLQDEYPDPLLSEGYLFGGTIRESKLCSQM